VERFLLPRSSGVQDADIRARVAAHRDALRVQAGFAPPAQYRRSAERLFTPDERDRVTILVGGLTPIHDRLVTAVFQTSGYRCEHLPQPDLEACEIGRQYCDVGLCNPAYFTVGNLIRHLRGLEARGLTRDDIARRYLFFTSGTCGPCRFGMYEAEYRLALRNAGFGGVRVLTFQQNDGLNASSGEPGLRFSVHFGMTALNAFHCADVLHDALHRVRPYGASEGAADAAFDDVARLLHARLRDRRPFDVLEHGPAWIRRRLARHTRMNTAVNTAVKVRQSLRGREYRRALADARARLDRLEIDRLRVKPVVKVTGEFWAAQTCGDGNFDMFRFLEREGAEARVDPIGGWVMYLLFQGRQDAAIKRRLARLEHPGLIGRFAADWRFLRRAALFTAGERLWTREYRRVAAALGGMAGPLSPQDELARLAEPFYRSRTRGGEGHLEVGKTIYYTLHHQCHMVLSLKPFGCLPSTQSDGVQSAVVPRLPNGNFVAIETSHDGAFQAYSRVQMALAEARAAAQREFDAALARTGCSLEAIRRFVSSRPDLRRATYQVPVHEGVAGTAANFVLHVGALMKRAG
jgi:predicted nucleotide-binding protein (sugar kinase/HSP70/actin superfamily)